MKANGLCIHLDFVVIGFLQKRIKYRPCILQRVFAQIKLADSQFHTTILWNDLTILWNDLTIDWNDLTWNDLTMERNDRIPFCHTGCRVRTM